MTTGSSPLEWTLDAFEMAPGGLDDASPLKRAIDRQSGEPVVLYVGKRRGAASTGLDARLIAWEHAFWTSEGPELGLQVGPALHETGQLVGFVLHRGPLSPIGTSLSPDDLGKMLDHLQLWHERGWVVGTWRRDAWWRTPDGHPVLLDGGLWAVAGQRFTPIPDETLAPELRLGLPVDSRTDWWVLARMFEHVEASADWKADRDGLTHPEPGDRWGSWSRLCPGVHMVSPPPTSAFLPKDRAYRKTLRDWLSDPEEQRPLAVEAPGRVEARILAATLEEVPHIGICRLEPGADAADVASRLAQAILPGLVARDPARASGLGRLLALHQGSGRTDVLAWTRELEMALRWLGDGVCVGLAGWSTLGPTARAMVTRLLEAGGRWIVLVPSGAPPPGGCRTVPHNDVLPPSAPGLPEAIRQGIWRSGGTEAAVFGAWQTHRFLGGDDRGWEDWSERVWHALPTDVRDLAALVWTARIPLPRFIDAVAGHGPETVVKGLRLGLWSLEEDCLVWRASLDPEALHRAVGRPLQEQSFKRLLEGHPGAPASAIASWERRLGLPDWQARPIEHALATGAWEDAEALLETVPGESRDVGWARLALRTAIQANQPDLVLARLETWGSLATTPSDWQTGLSFLQEIDPGLTVPALQVWIPRMDETGTPYLRARARTMLGRRLLTEAPGGAAEGFRHLAEAVELDGHRGGEGSARLELLDAAFTWGDARLHGQVLARHEKSPDAYHPRVALHEAIHRLWCGPITDALSQFDLLSIQLVEESDRTWGAMARACSGLGWAQLGDLRAAEEALADATVMLQGREEDPWVAAVRYVGAEAWRWLGRDLRALEWALRGLELGEVVHPVWQGWLHLAAARAQERIGELPRSELHARTCRKVADAWEVPALEAGHDTHHGYLEWQAERPHNAVTWLEEAGRLHVLLGRTSDQAETLLLRGRAARDQAEGGHEACREALNLARHVGQRSIAAEAAWALSQLERTPGARAQFVGQAHEFVAGALERADASQARAFLSFGERQRIHDHLHRLSLGGSAGQPNGSLAEALATPLGQLLEGLGIAAPLFLPDRHFLKELEDLLAGQTSASRLLDRVGRWILRRTRGSEVWLWQELTGEDEAWILGIGSGGERQSEAAPERLGPMMDDARRMRDILRVAPDELVLPFVNGGELLGGVLITGLDPREDPAPWLRLLASHVGVGLRHASLIAEREAALERAEALVRVNRAVTQSLELETMARHLLDTSLDLTGAEFGCLLLGSTLTPLCTVDRRVGAPQEAPYSEQIARRVLTRGQSLMMLDAAEHVGATRTVIDLQIQTIVAVPLVAHEVNQGVLYLASQHQQGGIRPGQMDILEAIAGQAALSIHQAVLFRDLRDSLHREKTMSREKERMARYLSSAALREVSAGSDPRTSSGSLIQATVMFADIRGFTTMAEQRAPHEVVQLLNVYMTRMERLITENGGILDKFIGDGIMAVFVPGEGDDRTDAFRAATAALAMQQAVRDLNGSGELPGDAQLEIGIGLNSGLMVAGNIGSRDRMDYTVVGDEVNLAARLESNARRGSVLISAATARLLNEGFALTAVGPLQVKGKSRSVDVFELGPLP
jgi:class 3 adenylate cyclase/GAF domain-containing protein